MTPKPHANPEIAALEAQWWKDWWAADYSWDGLTPDLRNYWDGEKDNLIAEPGTTRRWTRVHCPFYFADGSPSPRLTGSMADAIRPAPDATGWLNLTGAVLSKPPSGDGALCIRLDHAYIAFPLMAVTALSAACAWLNDGIDLNNASLDQLDLSGALVRGDARFQSVRFTGRSQFAGARLAGPANFSESVFSEHADFTGAHFGGAADFFGCRFQGRAIFDEVHFLDDVGFYKAAFVRRLTLNDARLYGRLNLEGATDGDPIAQSSQAIRLAASGEPPIALTGTLEPTAGPPERSFKSLPKLHARRTQFFEDANFSNRDLLSPSTFRDAVFHERAQFHGSDIHANVNLYGTNFRRALAYRAGNLPRYPEDLLKLRFLAEPDGANYATWKKTYLRTRIERRFDNFTADNYYNNLEASFRTLKQMMEERRDRLKEGEFFNLELRARRKRSDIPLWERITSYLYWLVSDYGNSIFRPMVMLLLLFGAMAATYYTIGQWRTGLSIIPADGHGLFSALVFSLQNVFAPFSVLDASKFNANDAWIRTVVLPADPVQSLIIKLLASTQSLLSLTLAFLAGLAGRRRFQIN